MIKNLINKYENQINAHKETIKETKYNKKIKLEMQERIIKRSEIEIDVYERVIVDLNKTLVG